MRHVLVVCFTSVLLLHAGTCVAANCPNLGVHPGVSTVFLQADFGEKDAASKAYVAGLQEAIKKSAAYCLVEDPRAVSYSLNLSGVDLAEDHERAAVSVVIISEKDTLISHWIRLSSIENVEKNSQDDMVKMDRAIQRYKRHR